MGGCRSMTIDVFDFLCASPEHSLLLKSTAQINLLRILNRSNRNQHLSNRQPNESFPETNMVDSRANGDAHASKRDAKIAELYEQLEVRAQTIREVGEANTCRDTIIAGKKSETVQVQGPRALEEKVDDTKE
ncbi:uncharacterized protein M421DRAFT_95674 [Didymella exigua CBS 183.55]|uniref:Uncharacterized protein n=1 Tax=Didymella exigua CBS 183.55 TaxID=1150837 RepID=A0A6A5R7H8_9PLEO|nr:uncharacterized protein M421DRAFT_95674 [Didymella exigua CBS 183.55]KAF1924125.1 hypothetical protein M421DRAFT_95674 [Didymella exigua CBS 183.55]